MIHEIRALFSACGKPLHRIVFALFMLCCTASLGASGASAQQIPTTQFTTLTGESHRIPDASDARPMLLVLAFSHAASADVERWNRLTKMSYSADARIRYFEFADLEGAPSFLRGMIVHQMRRAIPAPENAHFAALTAQDSAWKQLVSLGNPDVAYFVLADAQGRVLWQTHGPCTPETVSAVRNQVMRVTGATH